MSNSGAEPTTDWRHASTDRLWLDLPVDDDVDDLFDIHGDPDTWRHFPQGVHRDRARTEVMVASWQRRWAQNALSFWAVRDRSGGRVIGCGGCAIGDELPWWNLYYRFDTGVQGRGYAAELGRASLEAAHAVAADRPVIAFLLEHNLASRRTAERLGMGLVWTGRDLGNADPDAVRLVFCDREPDAGLLAAVEEKFRPVRGEGTGASSRV